MEKVKVIIVDDHKIFRTGLTVMLRDLDFVEEVREAESGREFLELIQQFDVDVVFMDIKMPDMNGVIATREALIYRPELRILALSMFEDKEYVKEMFDVGAMGYVLKSVELNELTTAIQTVLKGSYYYSNNLSSIIINKFLDTSGFVKDLNRRDQIEGFNMTERGYEILQLICQGLNSIEIAERLHLSPRTIQGHKARLYRKLGVSNSTDLIKFAIKYKLYDIS